MDHSDTISTLFAKLWQPYAAVTPQAQSVQALLQQEGEELRNDHVAFRTYNRGPLPLTRLAEPFLKLGYQESGNYNFEKKRLDAVSYSHPSGEHPRVFISELRVQELSEQNQRLIDTLLARLPEGIDPEDALQAKIDWPQLPYEDYQSLQAESEYAAWLSAFGIRVNHFTVSVNALKGYPTLESLNQRLVDAGYRLNGGDAPIQGSAACGLEQSSTIADRVDWNFAGDSQKIPSCYYEFAKRYIRPGEKELYDGFVTQSADRIFESTDARHHRA